MRRSGQPLAELLDGVELFPQTLINVRVRAGLRLDASTRRWPRSRAEVERELGDSGRVLIRASGTEPVLRVMVEARDAAAGAALRRSGWQRRLLR